MQLPNQKLLIQQRLFPGIKCPIEFKTFSSIQRISRRNDAECGKKSLRAFSKKKPFDYNKLAWREEALEPDKIVDVEWNDFSQKHFGRLKFTYHKGFYESNWVRFHRGHLNNGTLSWRICFNLFL